MTALQIGDRVRVEVKGDSLNGRAGTVDKIHQTLLRYQYTVVLDDAPRQAFAFAADELVVIGGGAR